MKYSMYNTYNNYNAHSQHPLYINFMIKMYFIISAMVMIGLVVYLVIYSYMQAVGMII